MLKLLWTIFVWIYVIYVQFSLFASLFIIIESFRIEHVDQLKMLFLLAVLSYDLST